MSVMQIQHGETTERGKPKEDYKFKQALKIRNLKNRLKKVLEACKSKTMELALSLEKLTNEKLLNLYEVASRNNDVQLADFVESEFLGEQVQAIKKISEYVAQLRRIVKGHGVWHFDQMLLN